MHTNHILSRKIRVCSQKTKIKETFEKSIKVITLGLRGSEHNLHSQYIN